jgi:IS5 family transposase
LAGHLRWFRGPHEIEQRRCNISETAFPQRGGLTSNKNDWNGISRMSRMRTSRCRITHQLAVAVVGCHKESASCLLNSRRDLPKGLVNCLHRLDSCGQVSGMADHIRFAKLRTIKPCWPERIASTARAVSSGTASMRSSAASIGLGRPAKPTRLMVGLSYLQHTSNLSDEAVVQRWIENPYWQWFCGCEYFQHEQPCDPSSLTHWRKWLGPEGLERLLAATIQAGLESGVVRPSSLERISVDTTVQPKAITQRTDARLYLKALLALVRQAKRHGLELRQTHTRLAKRAAVQVARYAHARQMRRMRRELKRLKTYLGRVYRDIARKVADDAGLEKRFAPLLGLTERLLVQERTSKNKLYGLHAPEVVCIAKGKAHRPYEFGSKVALAVTNREGFVLASEALAGNPYDGHALSATVDQVVALSGVEPDRIYVDLGYRGHDYAHKERVFIARQRRGLTPTIKRELRRRSAIEPMIGHMKADGRPGRNHLLGAAGDAMNALLVAGHCCSNLKRA